MLGEHLSRLAVDLKSIFALIPDAVNNVVVDLVVWECSILVNGINPGKKTFNLDTKIFYDYAQQNYWKGIFAGKEQSTRLDKI